MIEQERGPKELNQRESDLTTEIAQVVPELLERGLRILEAARRTLDGQTPADSEEIAAAFLTVEKLSRAGAEIIEAKGEIIFGQDQASPRLLDGEIGERQGRTRRRKEKEEKREGPTTFAELLKVKVDQALPQDRNSFWNQELFDFVNNHLGVKKAISAEGLRRRKKLTREEAIRVIQRFLATPGPILRVRDRYQRTQVLSTFPQLDANKFDEWSVAIGHDWQISPAVDFETMKQIRGLFQLEKILARHQKN